MRSAFACAAARRAGFRQLAMLAALELLANFGAIAHADAEENSPASAQAALSRLFNSLDHPLPVMPVAVPLASTGDDVDALLTPGNHPVVFMISNAAGPDSDPIKVLFFQEMAIEYLNRVNFRKVAAGSEAATHLYHNVTKPVYIIADPAKQGADRAIVYNEANLFDEAVKVRGASVDPLIWTVTQKTLEGAIYQNLGIDPNIFTPFALTASNLQKTIFESQPLSRAPTAKWVSVYFYRDEAARAGEVNRIRVMLWMESYFFPGHIREMDCNLTTQGAVYSTVLNREPPAEPELWAINPDKRQGMKYTPGQDGPALAELTHAAYVAWLAKNGVPAPQPMALSSEAVAQQLLGLKAKEEKTQQGQPKP